jgi:predicted esterase
VRQLFYLGFLVVALKFGAARGEVVHVHAEGAKGFHHDYLLLVPENVRTNGALVVATPTPTTSEDPVELRAAAERIAKNAGPLIGRLGLPVIVPVLPRPPLKVAQDQYIDVYYPALSRAAMESKEEKFARMDLQVLAMVDDARTRLREACGAEVRKKAIFAGFSAAGHFATRMAVMHPERVLAVWAGGIGGHPIVPVEELEGKALTYPVGIADLREMTGNEFAKEKLRGISIMFVQGEADANTSLPSDRKPSDSYSYEQAELVREVLGTDSMVRLKMAKAIWEKAGAKVEMKVYPEVGHRITPEIAREMVDFIAACLTSRE